MVKAKAQQMAMYPNMFSQRQREAVQQQLQSFQQQRQQLQQSGAAAASSSSSSASSSAHRDQWTNQVLSQQRDYQARISQERQQQAQTMQQAYIKQMQQQLAQAQRMASRQQRARQPEEITLDDDGDEGGAGGGGDDTIQLDGDPEFVTVSPPKSFPAPGTSRRGRPRLDPETDDPLGEVSHGARAMQQMREMAAAMKAKQTRPET